MDRREASIQRQHSQQMGIEYAKLMLAAGRLETENFDFKSLRHFIDIFDDDIGHGADRRLGEKQEDYSYDPQLPAHPQNPPIPKDRVVRLRDEVKKLVATKKIDLPKVGAQLEKLGVEKIDELNVATAEEFEAFLKAA